VRTAGAASVACAALLAAQVPFERHLVGFLGILAVWTGVSLALWRAARAFPGPAPGDSRRGRLVLAVAVLIRLPLVAVEPSPSTDAYRYSWEGRVGNAGGNPYRSAPNAPELAWLKTPQDARVNNPGLTTIYPPLALAAFRTAAALSGDVRASKAFFSLVDIFCCALLLRLLRRRGLGPAWAALYAWHPLVAVEFSAAGHLDSLMTLGLLGGIDLWETERRDAAALVWAAAALVKAVPVIVFPWLLVRRPRAALVFAAAVAAGLLPTASDLALAAEGLPGNGLAAFASDWLANPSLYAAAAAVCGSAATARLASAAAVFAFTGFWAARAGGDAARYLRGAVMLVLLASPVVQPWYVLWVLPLTLLSPNTAALAWSWAVGFLYVVLDPALKAASAGIPIWQWLWGAEYALVYGLLALGLRSRPDVTIRTETGLTWEEPPCAR
jgi:hypothetical protein